MWLLLKNLYYNLFIYYFIRIVLQFVLSAEIYICILQIFINSTMRWIMLYILNGVIMAYKFYIIFYVSCKKIASERSLACRDRNFAGAIICLAVLAVVTLFQNHVRSWITFFPDEIEPSLWTHRVQSIKLGLRILF